MSNIEVKNLTFSFKKNNVFTDLNFIIKSGSFTSIITNNQSNLMDILSGIIKTNAIYIDDKIITINEINQIGYVFLNDIFTNELVKEEILSNLKDNNDTENKLSEIAKTFDIENILNYNIRYLSQRQKKLVKIVSALIKKPNILILDNVFSIFNDIEKEKIVKILKKINQKEKLTIINITNNLEETIYGKDVIIIDNKLVVKGKTKKVLSDIKKVEKYGLPFMIDLSNKLKYYEIIDELILKDNEMVDAIWD